MKFGGNLFQEHTTKKGFMKIWPKINLSHKTIK